MAIWSRAEVEAIVEDYFEMREAELRGRRYNKSEHRRKIESRLHSRTKSAIEMKRQNISAVLIELGVPPLNGYVPLFNYQALLGEVVEEALPRAKSLLQALAMDVDQPLDAPSLDDILAAEVPAPKRPGVPAQAHPRTARETGGRVRLGVNYLALEAANRTLGAAGEEFVVRYEQARLQSLGKDRLADRVEHVAVTKGDGLGFDVLSFETEGAERLIEVKTTSYRPEVPFYVTRNELRVSRQEEKRYHICRVFDFRVKPRFFRKAGRLDHVFALDPTQYEAKLI